MNEALVPDDDWVENEDSAYDNPCPTSRAWHIAILEKAEAYVMPPAYGGI